MRDIIFRAKRTDNGEWVEGYYAHLSDEKKQSDRIYTGYAETDCGDFFPDWYEVNPDTVCELTGMIDKNGRRIFEGDVVRFKRTDALGWTRERVGQVLYYNELPVFYVLSTTGDAWDWYVCEGMEVIGNVFDNPDLIEP